LLGRKALTVALVCGGTNRFLDGNNFVVALGMTGRAYGRHDYPTDNGEEPVFHKEHTEELELALGLIQPSPITP
jgi:hypothetical protein